jgi:hypothetical protein
MKRFIVLLALLSPLSGCDLGHFPYERSDGFQITFRLLDTTGTPTAEFHTGPAVVFDIVSADTVVCTSVDGLVFAAVVLGGMVRDGETYHATWRAPNSPGRRPRISLAPGTYVARAHHGAFFDNYRIPSTNTSPFTVLPWLD